MFDFLSLMSGEIKDVLLDALAERLVCPSMKMVIPISVICQHENGTETSLKAYLDSKVTSEFWSIAVASGSATGVYNMLMYFQPTILEHGNEFRPSFAVTTPPSWVKIRYLELDIAQYNDLLLILLSKPDARRGFWRYMT